ncbi:hypothetical protein HYS91_00500 [Candidatus Daviesbacteria bacterium]|nr:hypothetical protein [Candidatus Daviesbacteria bacterium]
MPAVEVKDGTTGLTEQQRNALEAIRNPNPIPLKVLTGGFGRYDGRSLKEVIDSIRRTSGLPRPSIYELISPDDRKLATPEEFRYYSDGRPILEVVELIKRRRVLLSHQADATQFIPEDRLVVVEGYPTNGHVQTKERSLR